MDFPGFGICWEESVVIFWVFVNAWSVKKGEL